MEWIVAAGLIGGVVTANIGLMWSIGSYEMTGTRGWRRIFAGGRRAYDTWILWIRHWIASY